MIFNEDFSLFFPSRSTVYILMPLHIESPHPKRAKPVFSADPWHDQVSRAIDVGPIVLSADAKPDYVSSQAMSLLHCDDRSAFERIWPTLREAIDPILKFSQESALRGQQIDLSLEWSRLYGEYRLEAVETDPDPDLQAEPRDDDAPPPIRLRAEAYRLYEDDCQGFMLLLKDRASLDNLSSDLQRAARFETLNLMLHGVLHDLKAPLNAMALNLSLVREELGGMVSDAEARQLTEKPQSYIEAVAGEFDRLRRMLAALPSHQAQARGCFPKPNLRGQRALDLRRVVSDLAILFQAWSDRQCIALEVELPERPMRVHAEEDTVREAMVNIMVNAFNALSEGGMLTLRLDSGEFMGKPCVWIDVEDDGPGIDSAIRQRLFELYADGRGGSTNGGNGHLPSPRQGLGLYLTHRLMESDGGGAGVAR